MKVFYSARYHIDIGLHVFPTRKYRLVREALENEARHGSPSRLPIEFIEPQPATWDELALVHTDEYLTRVRRGTLSREDLAQLELPWSEDIVEGFRLMAGGTVGAAILACPDNRTQTPLHPQSGPSSAANPAWNVVCHIGGGLHHAYANHGEGFCLFNDVAVAVRVLQTRGVDRTAVVDLDVHHGNGTAFIFESDPRVFTFSMHQQHNYPIFKPRGSLDIGLPDGTHDDAYLRALEDALPKALSSDPQCVFYLAGADPYEDDLLGGLRLTKRGLRERDRLVIQAVRAAGAPLVIVLAGGYARDVDDTVAIHVATIAEAAAAAAS